NVTGVQTCALPIYDEMIEGSLHAYFLATRWTGDSRQWLCLCRIDSRPARGACLRGWLTRHCANCNIRCPGSNEMTLKLMTHAWRRLCQTRDKSLPALDPSTATTVSLASCGKARPSVRRTQRTV